jgi:uncharacterized membrane protein
MDDVAIARALHVLAVVIWIGGVAMVTMVVLPAVRDGDVGPNRVQVFEAIERRFTWPARIATVVVALTGFYMTQRLELWERFRSSEFWWMHAMVCLWLLFTAVLFVAEPLILHRWFHARASATPDTAFAFLHRAHWLLLVLSLITILGAVAGSQGTSLFWTAGRFSTERASRRKQESRSGAGNSVGSTVGGARAW